MMQSAPKPISSPARPGKFPLPLIRFLRSNTSGKNRGRLRRRRPLFLKKKKNTNSNQQQQEEPSSPKVTCIGQVRVKRSTSKRPKITKKRFDDELPPDYRRCCCLPGKSKPFFLFSSPCCRPSAPICLRRPTCWPKLVSFFCCGGGTRWVGSRKNVSQRVGSSVIEQKEMGKESNDEEEEEEEAERLVSLENRARAAVVSIFESEEAEEEEEEDITSTMPPKNALLLTRSRSAPYRSTSLAVRFWGSPNMSEEETTREEDEEAEISREQDTSSNRESAAAAGSSFSVLGSETVVCCRRDSAAEESRIDIDGYGDGEANSSGFPQREERECDEEKGGFSEHSLIENEKSNREDEARRTSAIITVDTQPVVQQVKESEIGKPMMFDQMQINAG